MKHALPLIAAALVLAACAVSDPFGSGQAPTPARLSGTGMPTMRAAVDTTPWTPYRIFTFASATDTVSASDMAKIADIVAYLKANPSLDVAIDGTATGDSASEAERRLGDRRASAVRRALMDTGVGVASFKIINGATAAPDTRRAGEVQVLVGPRSGVAKAGL